MKTIMYFFSIFLCCTFFCSCNASKDTSSISADMSLKEIDKIISTKLPIGSSRDEVAAFCKQMSFETSNDSSNEIFAIIRSNSSLKLTNRSVQIIFKFSENNILIKIDYQELFTGP